MELLLPYVTKIENGLKNLQLPENPANLYEPITYFLSIGGKRIRPILTLLAEELWQESSEKGLSVALGIEMFHNFTLLHDDIMDEADLRRNQQTIHEKWNVNTAILSGDVLFVEAMKKIIAADSLKINQVFLKTAQEVCDGQQLDMDFEKRNDVTIEEYINMIRLKTSVLLGGALQCGAILTNASDEDQKNIYAFGENIGIAFQLQDDLLDTFGTTAKVGKRIGGDILCNKKTYLYLNAFEKANASQKATLEKLKTETDESIKIEETKIIFNELNIAEITQAKIDEYFKLGIDNLNAIQVEDSKKNVLRSLVDFLYQRNY